jgi:hypothetical protein
VKFTDYSPPICPSPAQQRDAVQKGLGRAMQWAVSGRLDDGPLLEACLLDQRFDGQVEDPRGEWLWQMIREAKDTQRFRVPILHALYDLSDERSANQLCQLARCYGESGDETFRSRLYEIVEQKPFAQSPWLGEEEVVGLDAIRLRESQAIILLPLAQPIAGQLHLQKPSPISAIRDAQAASS